MKRLVKGLIFTCIIAVLLGVLGVIFYITYLQTNCNNAKEYLIEKYEFNEKKLFPIKYTEYIYEDIADCNSLWIKKCTDDPELLYKYTFKLDEQEIIVYEDKDGNLTDNYEDN